MGKISLAYLNIMYGGKGRTFFSSLFFHLKLYVFGLYTPSFLQHHLANLIDTRPDILFLTEVVEGPDSDYCTKTLSAHGYEVVVSYGEPLGLSSKKSCMVVGYKKTLALSGVDRNILSSGNSAGGGNGGVLLTLHNGFSVFGVHLTQPFRGFSNRKKWRNEIRFLSSFLESHSGVMLLGDLNMSTLKASRTFPEPYTNFVSNDTRYGYLGGWRLFSQQLDHVFSDNDTVCVDIVETVSDHGMLRVTCDFPN